ncbi:PREDICTED: uncharacterized protein LOC109583850 [Amphimedon queenslandica]|uniref:Death domain-containing protein n=1 Tax=Amphimedon queenslandica TaxID=400682 RepID=A0A1X7UDP3_AMPQE|nr:PREDICTED: uncharacterized protein LOC109583850 [Amphimedon queenslandica]|eukprot:XP_019854903.1 PREDICTED: uncharacterized protein LOC109583850 [Amphimedon queenslandica]
MILSVVICILCFFSATASQSAIVPEKESGGRVPLEDQLKLGELQLTLNTLKKYYYKGRNWQSLCLALGLTDDTIGVIETNHIKNVERCLRECLSSWLRKEDLVNETGGPNWETLLNALRSIGENAAAEDIDKEKQPACFIFNKFHKRIFSSIRGYPEAIATLLHKEEMISDKVLKRIETNKGMGTDILLDEVHKIVYKNYKNVKKFAVILKKFTTTELVGKSILLEYGKKFTDEETESVDIAGAVKIRIPRNYEPKFKELRFLWWTTILDVVNLIKFPASQEKLMDYFFIDSKFVGEKPVKESVLNIMKDKCSLIDITTLEEIIRYLEIQEAKPIIKRYKKMVEEFCKDVSLRFGLNETIYKHPILKGERITIEVNRKVDDNTLNDIEDLLQIAFENYFFSVKLVTIRESNSFIIICSFPLILTDVLTATAVKNIEALKQKGIQQLTIGYVNVYSHGKVHDTQESRNVSDLIRKSQLQVSMVQMEAIRHYIEEKSAERNPIVIKDSGITYYWISALIVICVTTFALLYLMADKNYKSIMEKLSSNTDKIERLQSSTSETMDQQLKTLSEDTETRLLSFKKEILRENSKSFLGLEESLAQCQEKIKELHDEVTEHFRKERLAPIM